MTCQVRTHIHDRLKRLVKTGLLGSIDKLDLSICEQCFARKGKRLPFDKAKRVNFPLELVHPNICGLMNVKSKTWNTILHHFYI